MKHRVKITVGVFVVVGAGLLGARLHGERVGQARRQQVAAYLQQLRYYNAYERQRRATALRYHRRTIHIDYGQ